VGGEGARVIVAEEEDGQRLERWLKKKFPELSFGQMQKILRTGQIRVDGKRVKGDARLVKGQEVRIPPQLTMPQPKTKNGLSQRDEDFIQSLVIYKDDHIIALNKPAGLATQGGSKVSKHVDGMLDGLKFGGQKPHLVHRLDKDTSGVLLLARGPKMAAALGRLFQGRDIRKYYWAVTVPTPQLPQGKIQSAIAKVSGPGGERMMAVDEDEGRNALTFYTVMEDVAGKLAWVAFWPRTGRQHQIRVHAAQMGCPLLGDFKYGEQPLLEENPDLPESLHLHARRLIFPHPVTGKKVDITAPLGPDMTKTFKYFSFNPNDKSDPFEDLD
jgi:23S rRNA pseudouridine955/2504/2580 synthase